MSSDNPDEKSGHRKPKVSWATLIVPGLVGPKLNPRGTGDGQQVNIPVLLSYRYEQWGNALSSLEHLLAIGV